MAINLKSDLSNMLLISPEHYLQKCKGDIEAFLKLDLLEHYAALKNNIAAIGKPTRIDEHRYNEVQQFELDYFNIVEKSNKIDRFYADLIKQLNINVPKNISKKDQFEYANKLVFEKINKIRLLEKLAK